MQKRGIKPTVITYNSMISACLEAGDLKGAEEFFTSMVCRSTHKCTPNVRTYNTLVCGYARMNCLEMAEAVLETMMKQQLQPTAATYTTLIQAYARLGNIERLHDLFCDMQS